MSAPTVAEPAVAESHHASAVLRCAALGRDDVAAFVAGLGMHLRRVPDAQNIPGSYWGDDEAGLIGNDLYIRDDTPVHSLLHELCHWLCMDAQRRTALHTNAGGEDVEEHAVCFLQCLLADRLPGYSRARCFADMDAWGYNFILGGAAAWFERDSDDARAFLQQRGLIDSDGAACREPQSGTARGCAMGDADP